MACCGEITCRMLSCNEAQSIKRDLGAMHASPALPSNMYTIVTRQHGLGLKLVWAMTGPIRLEAVCT